MSVNRLGMLVTACLVTAIMLSTARAVTFSDTDSYGIRYEATVIPVSSNLYDVSVTIDTTGYTGTQRAWLDGFSLRVSPQNPTSVSNVSLPTDWSLKDIQAGKVEFQSASTGAPPDSSDIVIPVTGGPIVTLSYRVDVDGTSLKMDVWPYQARYLCSKRTIRETPIHRPSSAAT